MLPELESPEEKGGIRRVGSKPGKGPGDQGRTCAILDESKSKDERV